MPKSRPPYPPEVRRQLVALVRSGRDPEDLAREFEPTAHGDARALPYPDSTFDAAYLVGVLGEIPDEAAALRELRRVLRPGGRLVVGEVAFDPDLVRFGVLERRADAAAFTFDRKLGGALSYLARFRPT